VRRGSLHRAVRILRQVGRSRLEGHDDDGELRSERRGGKAPDGAGVASVRWTQVTARNAGSRPSVPLLDLRPAHEALKPELLDDFAELIDSDEFVNGSPVRGFEQAFAEYCGTSFAVGMASGLDALRLALLAAGLERGDEVIVPAQTFVATLEAVLQAGGRPVLVDVGENDWNLAAEAARDAVTPRTRWLLPVHLYGQMADMRALGRLAESAALTVVEDACQAHGAARDGLRPGEAAAAAAFSFYPAKNLGAMGDAGALVTSRPEVAEAARALRTHGESRKYEHELEGYTARLDTIQALVLLRKLRLLDGWNEQRRAAARFYLEALNGVGDLRLPNVPGGSEPVWHLYVIQTARPAELARYLAERGIGTGRHYPHPVHLAPAYAWMGHGQGAFPVAERLAATCLSLPIFPGITDEQLHAVAEGLATFFRGRSRSSRRDRRSVIHGQA
jgi:dTDP-4-amino-4,6-dideoxygalactose transaminase